MFTAPAESHGLTASQEEHPSRAKYVHDFTKATGNMSEAVGA
jgi:hypothetical protein